MVDFSDYPDHDKATAVPNSKDATLTILVSEADRTAYHEETIAESHHTLQSEVEEVYKKKRERDKRELDLSKKPKVLVAVDKIKELFPETCRACGGAISLKQTMSGAVLTLQWNCDSGHFGTWASSDVLFNTVRNNQKVYVNNFQMAAAITQWK